VSAKYICKNIEKLLRYTLSCIDLSYLERVIILSDPPIKSSGSAPGRAAGRQRDSPHLISAPALGPAATAYKQQHLLTLPCAGHLCLTCPGTGTATAVRRISICLISLAKDVLPPSTKECNSRFSSQIV